MTDKAEGRVRAYLEEMQKRATSHPSMVEDNHIHAFGCIDGDKPLYASDIRALLARAEAAEAERDEARRRRDEWREKAKHYDTIRDALRAKTAGQDSRTLGRALLGAAKVEAEERAAKAEAERDRLLPWARLGDAVMEGWPEIGSIEGFDLHDWAVKYGVLHEIPGGYDPEHHIDSAGVAPEKGDPWFEIIASPPSLSPTDAQEGQSDA